MQLLQICLPDSRLQMPALTDADGLGLVPARLAVSPHDAGEGRVSLQRVAAVAAVGDGGAQLELGARPGPIAHQTRLEAGLPGVLCGGGRERQRGGKISGRQERALLFNGSSLFFFFLHHNTMLHDFFFSLSLPLQVSLVFSSLLSAPTLIHSVFSGKFISLTAAFLLPGPSPRPCNSPRFAGSAVRLRRRTGG